MLAVYHSYCLGFPEEFTAWLRARGGEVEPYESIAPQISALFNLPPSSEALQQELKQIFGPPQVPQKLTRQPWGSDEHWGATSFFCDGETAGLSAPITPADLPALKHWLLERGVTRPTLRLCAYDDTAKFATIASARCSGCGGALRYVEPKRYGLDAEQLGCAACGAMYELAVIRAEKPSSGGT